MKVLTTEQHIKHLTAALNSSLMELTSLTKSIEDDKNQDAADELDKLVKILHMLYPFVRAKREGLTVVAFSTNDTEPIYIRKDGQMQPTDVGNRLEEFAAVFGMYPDKCAEFDVTFEYF